MFEDDVMAIMVQDAEKMSVEAIVNEFAGFLDCHFHGNFDWSGQHKMCLDDEGVAFLSKVEQFHRDCRWPVSDGLSFDSLEGIGELSPEVTVKMDGGSLPVCGYNGFVVANVPNGDIISFKGHEGLYCLKKDSSEVYRMFDSYQQMIQLYLSLSLVDIYGITPSQFSDFVKQTNVKSTDMLSVLMEEIALFEASKDNLMVDHE